MQNWMPTQTLDVFSGGTSQEQVCSQIPSFSALQLDSYPEAASQVSVDLDPDLDSNNDSDSDNADLPSLGTLGEHLLATPAPSASSSRSNQSVLSPDQINSQLSACRDQLVKKWKHSIFNDDQIASLTQSQVHISDNNLKAIELQNEHQMTLCQEEHSFMEHMMEKMDSIAARRDAQMQTFMKDLLKQVMHKNV